MIIKEGERVCVCGVRETSFVEGEVLQNAMTALSWEGEEDVRRGDEARLTTMVELSGVIAMASTLYRDEMRCDEMR